ncbi:unnamed protein product [Merluccius merluccius]
MSGQEAKQVFLFSSCPLSSFTVVDTPLQAARACWGPRTLPVGATSLALSLSKLPHRPLCYTSEGRHAMALVAKARPPPNRVSGTRMNAPSASPLHFCGGRTSFPGK